MEVGRQRRSARLSALDKCKQERAPCGGVPKLENRAADRKGPGRRQKLPGKKRGRKKKKLQEVEETVVKSVDKVVEEAGKNLQKDGYQQNAGNSSSNESSMPEKQLLELILDVLQRKDTHEVFAEPVDSEEVEGYYEIIKNPMDFGTMRAKLQEGMYTSLEQFESDVLLICSNAMLFNSPSTVFFRQARSIQELAKKAFHALRTDPENFKWEFPSKRRRYFLAKAMKSNVDRTSQADTGNSDSNAKPATGEKSINLTSTIVANDRQKPLQGYSGIKRSFHEHPMAHGPTALIESQRISEDLSGTKDCRKSNVIGEERRLTYKDWTSFLNSNESLISTLSDGPGQLSYVNPNNISYTESLQRFVRDLGPTAQMVAQRKLQRCQNQALNFQTPSRNFQTPALQPETPAQNFLTPANPPVQRTPAPSNSVVHFRASRLDNMSFHSNTCVSTTNNKKDILIAATRENLHQNQSSEIPSCSYLPSRFGNSDTPVAWDPDSTNEYLTTVPCTGLPGNPTQSGDVNSEFSQSRLLKYMLRNDDSMVASPPWFQAMKASGSSQSVDSKQNSIICTFDEGNQAAASPLPLQVMKSSSSIQAASPAHNSYFRASAEENRPVASPPQPLQAVKASSSNQAANSMHDTCFHISDEKNQAKVSPTYPFQPKKPSSSSQAANSMHPSFRISDEENQAMTSSSWHLKVIKASGSNQATDSMHNSRFHTFDGSNKSAALPSWPSQATKASNFMNNCCLRTSDEENHANAPPSWQFQAMRASGSAQAANSVHNLCFHNSDEENQAAASPLYPLQPLKASCSSQAANSMHYSSFRTSNEENEAAASSFWPFQPMAPSSSSQAANSMYKSRLLTSDEEIQAPNIVPPDLNNRLDSTQVGQSSSWGRPELWGPQSVLDMSYLQARLGGMSSWGQNGSLDPELPPAHVSETLYAGGSHAGSNLQGELNTRRLFDAQPDLALQL